MGLTLGGDLLLEMSETFLKAVNEDKFEDQSDYGYHRVKRTGQI